MPLPLPSRFMREAAREKNHPFALLIIDSRGQSAEITSEADWGTATAESNADYTSTPPASGDVIIGPAVSENDLTFRPTSDDTNPAQWSGTYADIDEAVSDDDTTYMMNNGGNPYNYLADFDNTNLLSVVDNVQIKEVVLHYRARYSATAGTPSATAKALIRVNGTVYADAVADNITASYANYSHIWSTNPDTAAGWTKADLADIEAFGFQHTTSSNADLRVTQAYLIVTYFDFNATASITLPFDLGASTNTANKATISIDDLIPSGTGITYTIEGSTTGLWGGEEVALGAVSDGSSITGYRYYRITASFTSDGTVTGVLKSIKIEIPDNVYRFTTLPGNALAALDELDALPLVSSVPGRTIEIDLKSFVTKTSNMSINLARTSFVDEMVRGNNFRGLAVDMQLGMLFNGVTESDLIPYYQGRIVDYRLTSTELIVEVQDASKDLSAKWPIGTAPSTAPSQAYSTATHMVDVINEIIDDVGILSRYVDRGSLATVKSDVGDTVAAANYVVFRGVDGATDTTIKDSEPAKDYVTELLQLLGAYLVIPENGKLTAILYDAATAAEEEWGKNVYGKDANFQAGLKGLKNVTDLFYDNTGDGDELKNFGSIYITADQTSIDDWGITAIKKIISLWLAGDSTTGFYGDELAEEITLRETTRLKDGLGLFTCKTSLIKAGTQVGDFIDIDSDTIIKPDIGKGDTQKFMAIKKTWAVESNFISWILMEAR